MLQFFTSLKLTLGLLLLLALVSIGGTIKPAQPGHYELFYQSPWFRTILSLLALNLLCCTLRALPERWRSRERLFVALGAAEAAQSAYPSGADLRKRLRNAGYRISERDQMLLAERGAFGRWGVVIVHSAILLIMLGALWGEAGFLGTINTYLKQSNSHYFDWNAQRELELGFELRADDFRLRYYPIQLRFKLVDAATGRSYGQQLLYDNDAFSVPGTPYRVQLRGFDPDARLLRTEVFSGAQLLGPYLIGEGFERFGAQPNPGFRLSDVEFRDPLLKQIEVSVSVLEAGRLVRQGLIRVNEPLTHRGVSIYQTAYNRDQSGNWSVGFQLSKDPGEKLVWLASVLLMLGFAVVFLLRHRAVGLKPVVGGLALVPLKGWRGELGREQLQRLQQKLGG